MDKLSTQGHYFSMRIISFVTQKGGTGKSHLAISLAVMAEQQGEKVCLIDLDPQKTAANWYETRVSETPAVITADQIASLPEALKKLGANGYTLAIIDTQGSDTHGSRGAMAAADLSLIPIRPSEADIRASVPTAAALTDMGKRFVFLINQAQPSPRARLTSAVSLRLSTSYNVAPLAIALRLDHPYAYALGQGVSEYDPHGKAAAEIGDLWAWCRKQIGENKNAQKKRRA